MQGTIEFKIYINSLLKKYEVVLWDTFLAVIRVIVEVERFWFVLVEKLFS